MLTADYERHFEVLGKFAHLYDISAADESTLKDLLVVTADQVANADVADIQPMLDFSAYASRWNSAISGGPTALKSIAQTMASNYFRSTRFLNSLVSATPTNIADVKTIITALATEMSAANDNVTLSTLAATGLVNFFNSMLSTPGTWNTEADATADYKDSVYVVATIV